MRPVVFVPIGLLVVLAIAVGTGVFWLAVTAAVLTFPAVIVAVLDASIRAWWDRRQFMRAIRSHQDGTYVPEWQRRV